MRRRLAAVPLVLLAGCSSGGGQTAVHKQSTPSQAVRSRLVTVRRLEPAQQVLHLPPVPAWPLPGYLLVADRDNNRVVLLSPSKRIVWSSGPLRGPDDAFFTPGYRSVITNEEFNDTLTEMSLTTKQPIWRYGHDAVPGSNSGYLDTPDDAYRLPNGSTTTADIRNCRIVVLSHSERVQRVIGGSCVHDPPRGFASPNGDTPLPDGGLLVTEIGPPGWIDRLDPRGRLVWSVQSPVPYPSDAQLLPDGRILVASFTVPGTIVELTRTGRVTWSFGAPSGPNMLAKPSLAVRFPNGLIAANDDYNQRVILIDPRTKRIVWQYGHTGVSGSAPGYLDKPDGLDFLPSATRARPSAPTTTARTAPAPHVVVTKVGSLPRAASRLAAVALPDGRLVVLGGLVRDTSSDEVLIGPPQSLAAGGRLPMPTHDDAAVLAGGRVYLYGGGQAVSSSAVVRVDGATGTARTIGQLAEPLSDLGAATVGADSYLVGGYTGSRFATAILRVRGTQMTVVGRLPHGLRYAGVAALGKTIYVAGGLTPSGATTAIDAFDPATGTVRRLGRLPEPLAHAPLVAASGALYLVGGRLSDGRASARILRIDPVTGSVRVVGRLPQPLADADAVEVHGGVVVLGGASTSASRAVLEFRPLP